MRQQLICKRIRPIEPIAIRRAAAVPAMSRKGRFGTAPTPLVHRAIGQTNCWIDCSKPCARFSLRNRCSATAASRLRISPRRQDLIRSLKRDSGTYGIPSPKIVLITSLTGNRDSTTQPVDSATSPGANHMTTVWRRQGCCGRVPEGISRPETQGKEKNRVATNSDLLLRMLQRPHRL